MAASKSNPSLKAQAEAFLATRTTAGDRLCVGLSGGRDSVVLLHLLAGLGLGARLGAMHVHHGLSPRADAWAEFCIHYCARLGVPLTVSRVGVDRQSGFGLEAAARQARYRAFAECDAEVILLAHHRSDQAETLLFNLLRGAGVPGAAAMPVERGWGSQRVLRPLLAAGGEAIAAYAAAARLDWVEDESNDDLTLTRNFLRREVMPLLETRFPAAQERLAAAAANFAEADALLAELGEADWNLLSSGGHLPLAKLRALSPTRLKNLLRWRLRALGWRTPVATRLDEFTRQLLQAAPGRRPRLELPDGEMRVMRGVLHWLPLTASAP